MDRFHKAARDGYLDVLKEATRKACNTKDEDGMTPTLWAAFEGNLDALRMLVGRGGDPDRCDNYGNTALHFSAARGHMGCVSFLVNFGVNLWALDIDFHTAKDLAAMNSREDILRFLDGTETQEETRNRKKVKELKDKAQKEAEKRSRDFQKIHKKAEKLAVKEQRRLQKQREKMERPAVEEPKPNNGDTQIPRQSTAFLSLRKDSKQLYGQSPTFSDIVNSAQVPNGGSKRVITQSGVYKKVLQVKKQAKLAQQQNDEVRKGGEFKTTEIESDGKRSVRSLSGLRRDSEIMYIQKYDTQQTAVGKRGKISDVFDSATHSTSGGELSRSISEPDFLHAGDSGFVEDVLLHEQGSIFDRPGFGSVAFRNSITALSAVSSGALRSLPSNHGDDSAHASDRGSDRPSHLDDSIGSAGSLAQRNRNVPWDEEDLPSDDDDDLDDESGSASPLHLFLDASGLLEFLPHLTREKIDLEALMLLSDEDLKALGLPLGPRRKLLKAISERTVAIENPGEVRDSRL